MTLLSIAVQCHNYQKRLCWMLSSLSQQTKPELFCVDIAFMRNNGRPSTEACTELFRPWIQIRDSSWENYVDFEKRGLVRNQQLRHCQSKWLLFADCDMVYHPEYVERLCRVLETTHRSATYMLSSGRMSSAKEEAIKLVDSTILDTPVRINNAFYLAQKLSSVRRRNAGAGFSQLINLESAPHGGYYVNPQKNADWSWSSRFHKTRSDIQFRHRIAELGGERRKLPEWFTRNLIHLNHNRDKEVGYHLEEQR